jgi:polar amino acid transport system substrate-binding protein
MTATAPRRPRFRPAATIAAVVLILAGCGSSSEEPFESNPAQADAGGDGGTATTVTPDPACDEVDPRPSLEPEAPLAELTVPPGSYLAEIRDRGTLRAGVGADTLLFGYLNPQSAALEGFDVEMARLVADAIFGDPDRIELIPVQSPDRIARLQDGSVDLVVKTMTITCARWAEIDFSTVYYEAGQKLLVSTDAGIGGLGDLDDEVICAVSGTTSLQRLQDEGVATVESDSWTECLVDFQQGVADGVSTDDTILAGLAAQDPYAQVVGEPFSSEPYGIGLPKGSPELTRFVNAVLEQARTDGTWQALYDQWLADTLGPAQSVPPASYRP